MGRVNGQAGVEVGSARVEYCWAPGEYRSRDCIIARVQSLKPDLVWLNLGVSAFGTSPWHNLSGFLLPMALKRLGYPTVVTLHEVIELANLAALAAPGGPLAVWGARWLTSIALQADVVCLTMPHYVEWLARRGRRARLCYIPTGAYYPPERLPDPDQPGLLFFSTIAPFKGLEVLLEAFQMLHMDNANLRLVIAGVEHVRFPGYLQQLQAEYRGLPGVEWLGEVEEEELRALFQDSRVVILPYLASTGSSSVLIQAAAWGRPIVASNLPELQMTAREVGLEVEFFERGSAPALVESVKRLLASPTLREQQVVQNLAALRQHRPEAMSHAYLQALNLALETRSASSRLAVPFLSSSDLT